jgi:hypothetical protein
MKLKAISLLLTLTAAGNSAMAFSTKPITMETGTPVPASKIRATALTKPAPERTAKVSFLRDDGGLGGACTHKILVDGAVAFEIRPGEYQTLYLAPGKHSLGLKIDDGFCPELSISQSTVLGDGADESYRIFIPSLMGRPHMAKLGGSTGDSAGASAEPSFKWDSDFSTPGTSLTVKETGRIPSPTGTQVAYQLTAPGFSDKEPAILWWKRGTSYEPLKATIGENGAVAVLGTPSFMIESFVLGQAVDLALVSGSNRAQAKTVPFPISVNKDGHSASVELMSDTGLLFQITFGGFQPGESVDITSEYKAERPVKKVEASARGEVIFPVVFGRDDRGTATATASGSSGAVSIQYKVGKQALVRQ